ncbi:hypothetical protein ScPMuIL_000328 [Solemya velum]
MTMFAEKVAAAVAIICLTCVSAYPSGPPVGSCVTMFPSGHNKTGQTSETPFEILISKTSIKGGDSTGIEVTLRVKDAKKEQFDFEGVFVQARKGNSPTPVGTFKLHSGESYLKTMKCTYDNSAVSHKKEEEYTERKLTWLPPASVTEKQKIQFRGTFVKNLETFWIDVKSPELTLMVGASPTLISSAVLILSLLFATRSIV